MSLKIFQHLLARLYLQGDLRERFVANPRGFLRSYDLTPMEARALAEIDQERLRRFCAGLSLKNSSRLRANFPVTARLLGKRFMDIHREYGDRHGDLRKWPSRLEAFAELLLNRLDRDGTVPRHAVDLARLEYSKAMLNAHVDNGLRRALQGKLNLVKCSPGTVQKNGRRVAFSTGFVGNFSYDLFQLIHRSRQDVRRTVAKKKCLVLFYQESKHAPVQVARFKGAHLMMRQTG